MNFQKMKDLGKLMHNKKMIVLTILCLGALIALTGVFVYEATKNEVVVVKNGKELEIRTHAKTVEDILIDLEIPYKSQDYLNPAINTAITNGTKIEWKPAQEVTLVLDGKEEKLWTIHDTVEELLQEKDITVSERDEINVGLDTNIENGLQIEIEFAFPVIVNDGGKEKEIWTTSTTVAGLLEQHEIQLNELDRVEPGLEQAVEKDMNINVIRVEKVTDVVEETIAFGVVSKKDNSLEKGKEKVVQQGKEGKLQKKYEVVLENGEEVSRTLVSEEVIEESQDKIVAVGTKVVQPPVSRGAASSGNEIYVTATAYTAECNGCSGVTSTGINLKANPNSKVIAVDPSVIPLGTKVYVEGYGHAIAADTGGSIRGNKIDVFFPTKSEAYRWGMKKVKVTILK